MVSVVMITYAHEKYIENAIEGVLSQNCTFNFELIIADDSSSDNTNFIIDNIIKNHINGNIVKYKRHNVNIGMMPNFIWGLSQANGKYIALCEGDDFWTDSYKLQKQVDFLETNQNFSMCFHSVEILNETINSNFRYPKPFNNILKFHDILFRHYIPTCSLVFVNDLLERPLPDWLNNSKMGDIPIELFLADKGKVFYMNDNMAVYRLNNGGITQNKEHIRNGRKAYNFLYLNLRKHFGTRYFILFTIMIFKNKIGSIKDFINQLKKSN
jgi:glycosyltransferase involved in cell wall biosynthesis